MGNVKFVAKYYIFGDKCYVFQWWRLCILLWVRLLLPDYVINQKLSHTVKDVIFAAKIT